MLKKVDYTLIKIVFTGLILILVISFNAHAVGIGISPGSVSFDNVMRGGYAQRTVIVSTSSGEPLQCEVRAEGPFKDWVTFSTGKTFTMPPKSQFRLKIIVQPPDDIPNGLYNGYITVAILPEGASSAGTGAAISAAVSLKSSITINDLEILHYKVSAVSVKDTEERMPLEFSIGVENDGNIRLYPKIHIDILSEDKGSVLKSVDYSEKLLLPTTKDNLLITIDNDLPIGKYWGTVSAHIDDEMIYDKTLGFEVLERGSLRVQGKLLRVELNKIWVDVGEIVEVTAYFQNTGVLATSAIFKGKATVNDTVMGIIESDEVEIPAGQSGELVSYFTPKETGRHIISGKVHFSRKVTHEKSSILNVMGARMGETTTTTIAEVGNGGTDIPLIIAVFVILIFVILGVFLWRRRATPAREGEREGGLGGV